METKEYFDVVDKRAWQRGPWDNEPDKVQWLDGETGYPCLIVRGPVGAWCGYVGVPAGHPLYRKDYDQAHERAPNIEVHFGLTYADECNAPTRERWEKIRVLWPKMKMEAEKYPEGDAAKWCKRWFPALNDYAKYVEIMESVGICHTDEGEDSVWWFGFDCAHCDDLAPSLTAHRGLPVTGEEYRDVAYVKAECAKLAKQLKEAAKEGTCTPAGP